MKCTANERTYKKLQADNLSKTVKFYAILFAYTLADKYGFGKSKLQQVLTTVTRLAEEIKDDDIKIEELSEMLKDEYNIHIK